MPVWIQITSGSDKPIYTQIIEQVSQAVAKGQLSAGDKLPPVRKLAAELVINPNTVANAYRILEKTGLVTTKPGSGTYVIDPKLRSRDACDINILAERMDAIISHGLNLGFEAGQLLAVFQNRLRRFANKSISGDNKNV